MHPIYWFTFLGAFALGCAENIGKDGNASDTGSHMDNVTNVGGTTTTTIDATDEEAWVYLEFESSRLATVTSPETDLNWDIGLRRYHVKINGGVSGSGDMALSIVSGGDFDAITAAPADGYITDTADDDEDGVPEYAMETWYDYDHSSHLLSPSDQVYVLRTVEGNYVKLRFDDYYDEAGTSGIVTFTWGMIDPASGDGDSHDGDDTGDPGQDDDAISCTETTDLVSTEREGTDSVTMINSESGADWACMRFSDGTQVENQWSMAWQQWTGVFPSGTKGAILEGEDYDALSTAPVDGWQSDNLTLLSDWYDYDPSTHILTPKDRVYALMDPDGGFWKLKMVSYYAEDGTLHRPTFRWAPLSAP